MVARRELQRRLLDAVRVDEDNRHGAVVVLLMHMQVDHSSDVEIYGVLPQPLSAIAARRGLRRGSGLRAELVCEWNAISTNRPRMHQLIRSPLQEERAAGLLVQGEVALEVVLGGVRHQDHIVLPVEQRGSHVLVHRDDEVPCQDRCYCGVGVRRPNHTRAALQQLKYNLWAE